MTNSPRKLAHILVILALALAIAIPGMSFAKGSRGGKPSASPAPATHTTIMMISPTLITVKEPKGTRDLVITQFTSFTYKGSSVRIDALKPGMRVAIGTGTDPRVAERIDADDAPPAPVTAKKK